MASVLSEDLKGVSAPASEKSVVRTYVNYVPAIAVGMIMVAIFVAYRLYQQEYAFSMGLDSTSAEFETYWMSLLYIQLPLLVAGWAILWSYLWITRDRHLDKLNPHVELKRYFYFIGFIFLYALAFFAVVPLFGENDAAWHQTVVRDTSFTPSHIVVFYFCIPAYITLGVGSYLYAMTRLPKFAAKVSLPLAFAVTGPFMILPNLGYNEWGHAFWLMEEIFSHPLHWGFVVMGWTVLALGGLLTQVMFHMIELIRKVRETSLPASMA